ncbi:efflux RND transporter periplasmic adaptor subunit [Brevibacillus sp. HB1.4B]|uniref:efflux RND transporter periplasmic adaptor subunit n=1 Tax=unclassified Brevibacillus TaxID=2684853 RepID=UPI00156B8C1B|nr:MULTISPECIES: efflux RND transporter periplasmic adaptor subunit [unclassified Brevibacillus]NRS16368.1 efflux RND transporter periplasmic adaptor subunit [Brevibacillus sp. HB1.4B]NTU32240.1 efflux RND transporter periplasmic adaptor subunit [Brevibacillus sp. HB1.1]
MDKSIRKSMGLLVLVSLAVMTTACTNNHDMTSSAGSIAQAEAKFVEAHLIQLKSFQSTSELSGTLAPMEETTVSFEVAGEIKSLPYKEGDTVKKGDVLARLHSTDYSLQLALANANVHGANAQLSKVKNGAREQEVQQAKVAVEAKKISRDQAQKDYQRMEQLYKNGAISETEFESAKHAFELAEKDYAQVQETYSLVKAGARTEDISATNASYQGAMVTRDQAAATLAKTEVKAPIQGTVLAKLADVGQLANPGAPVYRIGNIHQLKTILPVPDKDISSWKVGDEVEIRLYEEKRKGKVTNIYPATNEQTGTISVEVVIDNTKKDWFAGQVVTVKRTLSQKKGIFVPAEAVFSRGSEPYVFLLTDGKATKTTVTIGQYVDNHFEVTSGLQEGDMLIMKGADRLLNGDSVTVKGGNQP